jgi:putative membrane protein
MSMNEPPRRRDWERRLLGGGEEPDPRFTLANERTFLAWIRTALALVAGAVATDAVTAGAWPDSVRHVVVLLLLVAGLVLSSGAAVRWLRVERAMRARRPLPLSSLVPILSLTVLLGTIGALALVSWP